nr:zinc finger, CCHC-type [Tanacetum cinerariifolium]
MAAAMKHMVANFSKLDKFERVNFSRWQKKMHFLLSTMSVVYALNTLIPDDWDDTTIEQIKRREKWENHDYVCRSIIHNENEKGRKPYLMFAHLASYLTRLRCAASITTWLGTKSTIPVCVKCEDPIKTDPKVTCWKCGKPRHLKKDCKGGKVGNKANGSGINSSVNDSSNSLKGYNMFDKSFQTFDESMKSQDVAFWKKVINDEMDSIMGNNTWVLADLPSDYFDTYAPMARINTIILLIALASIHNLIIHHMYVKTTFLNGELDEKAPKKWYQKFDEVVLSNGYLLNQADKYVYSKFNKSGKGVIICLYVDDMLIFGTDQVQVNLTNEFLSSRFMNYLEEQTDGEAMINSIQYDDQPLPVIAQVSLAGNAQNA